MIDWNRLTLEPAIERLGALLREQFGVWVGFVDRDGGAHPIGERLVSVDKPACQHFMAHSVLGNQTEGGEETCAQSLRRFAEKRGEFIEAKCHAGFAALLSRFETVDGDSGCVYVSGYVDSERAHQALGAVRERLRAQKLLEGEEEADQVVDGVPRLDRRQRKVARSIARHIAEEARRILDSPQEGEGGVEIDGAERFHGMVAASRKMRDLFETIRTVADSRSTVLIEGENGTGKELIARALHLESSRCDHPFVALNCAAIPAELIASELFGHKKGAFSGAHRDRQGLLEQADGGTLLLDEIGDMDLHLQVKLLRFLQEGTFLPVGSNTRKKVDVRVICATNRDIRQLVREGEFRRDLYFRINVIHLAVPPLRERPDDIGVLAEHFLARAAKQHQRPVKQLDEGCRERLYAYDWPGNVRELENEIERVVIMSADRDAITANDLSERISPSMAPSLAVAEGMELPDAIEQLERAMILRGLQETGWNKSQAARDLGVSRRTLIRKVSAYDLEQFRDD